MIVFDAQKLTEHRTKLGLSREALAARMQELMDRDTISAGTIGYWEDGGIPRSDFLWALSQALSVPMEAWFSRQ